jgi:hypothetical protein
MQFVEMSNTFRELTLRGRPLGVHLFPDKLNLAIHFRTQMVSTAELQVIGTRRDVSMNNFC